MCKSKLIIENMQETIFVVSGKQIEMVNDQFLSLFQSFIQNLCKDDVQFQNEYEVPKIKQFKHFLINKWGNLKKFFSCH